MKSRLDGLRESTQISYRSQTRIASQNASLVVDDKGVKVEVNFNSGETLIFNISDIESVKPKDYPQAGGGGHVFLLTLCYTEEAQKTHGQGAHSALEFPDRDVRDLWDHGLRSLITSASSGGEKQQEVSVPTQQLLPIKGISLRSGDKSGELMTVTVELGKRNASFAVSIPEPNYDREAYKKELWQKIVTFIADSSIVATETMSVYRYVRCVVQRALMEKEVTAIIEDINNQNLDTLMKKRGDRQPGVLDDDQLHQAAERHLDSLGAELPDRIGSQGSGAVVVTQVLMRNIAKMKLVNNVSLKLAKEGA